MKLQIIRRCVQGGTLLVTAAVALLALYGHYRAARVIDDEQLMAGMQGELITRWIHPYIDRLPDVDGFLDANQGTLWSMRLAGVEWTDPLAAAEAIATSSHVHWPLIVSIVIPVVLTLLLGRVFCSWMCPAYLLFELTGKLRKLLRFAEIEPGNVKFSHADKYVFLLIGLIVAALFSKPLFALIYPPAVISRALHAWVFGTALTGMIGLLAVIVAMEMLVSPRWWCRTMCPGGALYGLLGWLRPLRVKLKTDQCTGCRDCIPVCEAGINPVTQSSSIECDNCGVCIRHCGEGALVFTIGLPERTPSRKPGRNHKALSVAAVAAACVLWATPPAYGHHILGLPHYSYKENYPQRPTLEYPATTGPYRILLTSYPGIPTPGEPANLAFYIKNQRTGQVYEAPVEVRVLQTSTFGDNRVVMPPTSRRPFDNEYKYHVTFPEDGEYIVELSMDVEGRVEVIPFLVIAGEPTATASFLLAAGSSSLLLAFIVIRAIQKKRGRRRRDTARAAGVSIPSRLVRESSLTSTSAAGGGRYISAGARIPSRTVS